MQCYLIAEVHARQLRVPVQLALALTVSATPWPAQQRRRRAADQSVRRLHKGETRTGELLCSAQRADPGGSAEKRRWTSRWIRATRGRHSASSREGDGEEEEEEEAETAEEERDIAAEEVRVWREVEGEKEEEKEEEAAGAEGAEVWGWCSCWWCGCLVALRVSSSACSDSDDGSCSAMGTGMDDAASVLSQRCFGDRHPGRRSATVKGDHLSAITAEGGSGDVESWQC